MVANRTLAKAIALVQRHAPLALRHHVALEARALHDVHGTFDVVINATASSLSGGEVPVDGRVLEIGALAVDMMYAPPLPAS